MIKIIALLITLFFPASLFASPVSVVSPEIKEFVGLYLERVKNNNIELLKKMSVSDGTCQYGSVSTILKNVGDAEYTMEVKPFSKDSAGYKFAVALNKGKPAVLGKPTHIVNVKWQYQQEEFTIGHQCYALIHGSAEVSLAISNRKGIIKEHTVCEEHKNKPVTRTTVSLTKANKDIVKKWIRSQKTYSRLKTRMFIAKKFGYNRKDSKIILKKVCAEM